MSLNASSATPMESATLAVQDIFDANFNLTKFFNSSKAEGHLKALKLSVVVSRFVLRLFKIMWQGFLLGKNGRSQEERKEYGA